MSVIIILVIVGAVVAGGFLLAFIWSVKSGQYDDTYSPAVRILFDDAKPVSEEVSFQEDGWESKGHDENKEHTDIDSNKH